MEPRLCEEEWRGESIGVTECSSSAYISSSLCPGQRVQWLRAVFSIPSTPTHLLSQLPNCTYPLYSGISSLSTWLAIKRALCACLCVCLATSITYRKHLQMKKKKLTHGALEKCGYYLFQCLSLKSLQNAVEKTLSVRSLQILNILSSHIL